MIDATINGSYKKITDKLTDFLNITDGFKIPVHVVPFNPIYQLGGIQLCDYCFNEIKRALIDKYMDDCIEFPDSYKFNEQHYSKVIKANLFVKISECSVAFVYKDGSCVVILNDSEYYNSIKGDDKKFISYKGEFHNDLKTGIDRQNFSNGIKDFTDLLEKTIKLYYENNLNDEIEPQEIEYKISYTFSMLFSEKSIKDEIKAAILDPRSVVYDPCEYDNKSIISARIKKIDVNQLNYMKKIDTRQEYNAYFSWAAGVVDGISSTPVIIEYCLIEAQMQNRWNCIYKYGKSIEESTIKKPKYDKIIEELTRFERDLNSLDDASDSERLRHVRKKIIKSSKITDIINQIKCVIKSRKSKFTIRISITALITAIIAGIIGLTSFILQLCAT